MASLFAAQALLPDGWHADVQIQLGDGRITAITPDTAPSVGDERHQIVIPAVPNVHSHAFQRAMAGLTEQRGPGADSFWSWRSVMYRFALSMTPDDVEAVAAQLYVEMLEAGFARVGEFHYLHHDQNGQSYADIGEMAGRIAAASVETGIGLTLLPVFYAHSGFGAAAPSAGQLRFINSLDGFGLLAERCKALAQNLPGANFGVAPHSLRAATIEQIRQVQALAAGGPVHIHVAEQMREVTDCIEATGARPVQYLLANAPVDHRWCLIHATHVSEPETKAMATSGATIGLCPITEANLGDGIFPAKEFLANGGRFGIGSDSNIVLSVAQELRQLEYSQRLGLQARNVIAPRGASTGRTLLDHAVSGGASALGVPSGIVLGQWADLVSLNTSAAPYLRGDDAIDGWIFGSGIVVDCVWALGRKQVSAGRHVARQSINRRFTATMSRLMASS